jgi:hypothetical protein
MASVLMSCSAEPRGARGLSLLCCAVQAQRGYFHDGQSAQVALDVV